MNNSKRLVAALIAAGTLVAAPLAGAADASTDLTPAAKIDSGLGELPNAAEWREPFMFAQPAAKVDSGLGEISGAAGADALHPVPAPKADTGLGVLPRYTEWNEPFMFMQPAAKADSGLGNLPRYAGPHQ